jgi:hypothetical protein
MEPCKLVHWTCPTQLGNKVRNKQNVLKVCSTCLQVPPPPNKWLVDHNPAKLFSHRFVVKGILKSEDGTWIDKTEWLRLNRPDYDASYQITVPNERQAAEQLYLYQQAARLVELCENSMPQAEAPREYLELFRHLEECRWYLD